MRKSKLIFLQTIVAISLICTSVYATVSATIGVTPSSKTVERGETVTVTLSLKNVDSSKKVESVSGYINYDKNVIEPITVDSIHKSNDNTVSIGSETLAVEDLTNKDIGSISTSGAYVAFNGNPTSNNDTKIVIDFKNGITSNVDLLSIDFKVKSNATLGNIKDAISYSMFVITANSEESDEITEKVELTVKEATEPVQPTEKTLSEITITTAPTKTTYTSGEKFDKSGMVVTAKYSDGTTKTVTNYTYSPTRALTTSDSKVTISYTEGSVTKTVDQKITVKADEPTEKTLSEITITTVPTKTSYTEGEKFDKSGMVVTAKYSDGTTKAITNYTFSPTRALTTSDSKVTISYTEGNVTKTIEQKITVQAATTNNNNTTNNTNNTVTNNSTNNSTKNTTNTNKDNTVAGKNIPATGAKLFVVPLIILAVLAYVSYNKYMKYKDI